MTSKEKRFRGLRQDALDLASEYLDHDIRAYHALSDVAVRLTDFIQENGSTPSIVTDSRPTRLVKIYATCKGVPYEAQLDTSRISDTGRGDCVLFDGQYMSASAAAMKIASSQVNGWEFWRYERDNGTEGRIKELR